jgi:signal transduction histidine kinase
VPVFLSHVVAVLREDRPQGDASPAAAGASGHGGQRLRLGFSLDSVVREYGALRNAIVEVARSEGVPVTDRELEILFEAIITGIAVAVVEYTTQRDAELRRQTNEHLAFVAHELRNPLASATLALAAISSKGGLDVDPRAAAILDRGLRRTGELVEHTLRSARLASGIELRRSDTTLRAVVEEAQAGAGFEADQKQVEIRIEIQQDGPMCVDTRLVHSALSNLVQNAVKHTPARSCVIVRGRIADSRAVIEIEDRCGGLPDGKVEEAFAPFVRLDAPHGSGFGLGLAIAKQAVDAHGGTIRVQNLPGTGCIFVLELPAGAVGAPSPTP